MSATNSLTSQTKFDSVQSKRLLCLTNTFLLSLQVELTPETLPVLFKTKKPQVLLFLDDKEHAIYNAVEELAQDKDVMNKFGFSYLTMYVAFCVWY